MAPNVRLFSATDALRNASTWEPKPWPVDRMAALEELRQERLEGAEIVWLSDGVATRPRGSRRGSTVRRRSSRRWGRFRSSPSPRIDALCCSCPPRSMASA